MYIEKNYTGALKKKQYATFTFFHIKNGDIYK